mmetsp:Transcript_4033/g.6343  ORF Transcript_4033/g.6343 Transcript_4033/m.6343 type:complete len:107 (-) Transcript_4033:86-406(-)
MFHSGNIMRTSLGLAAKSDFEATESEAALEPLSWLVEQEQLMVWLVVISLLVVVGNKSEDELISQYLFMCPLGKIRRQKAQGWCHVEERRESMNHQICSTKGKKRI